MIRTLLKGLFGLFFPLIINAQVGIGTNNPHASAILELNSSNKGFKGPGVSLTGKNDAVTIPNPQPGLLVYNLSTAGTFPNDVVAGEYYFWNGSQWKNIATQSQIQNLLERGIYVLNEDDTQSFPDINTGSYYEVAFPSTAAQVDKGNIITKSGNIFTVQKSGLYQITAAVYYSPLNTDQYNRNLLNIIMQKKSTTDDTWTDIAGGRRAWGAGALDLYQTAFIPTTCVLLQQGDLLRVVIRNPMNEFPHGTEAKIQAFPDHPRSKYIKIQLLNN